MPMSVVLIDGDLASVEPVGELSCECLDGMREG